MRILIKVITQKIVPSNIESKTLSIDKDTIVKLDGEPDVVNQIATYITDNFKVA